MEKIQFPKLDSPGAGLPWMEQFFLKNVYYPLKHSRFSWTQNLDRFQAETQKILSICDQVSEKDFQTRILVPRLRGMEDSSRFWSVALAIEHLCITMDGMSFIASELAQEKSLSLEIKIANVKPKQENVTSKAGMIKKFKQGVTSSLDLLEPLKQEHSNQHKLNHPWFGPITSDGWVWVLGQHQALHRKQIQLIVEHL